MRIGIPRALMYYEFYPLWRTFLARLGFDVVMSSRTTKAILERGVALAPDEACLPVKLGLGHVDDLAGRCDAMFIPRLLAMSPKGFFCPKIVGFPDMVRALPIDSPPLVAPIVDLNKDPDPVRPFIEAARELGVKARRAREAYAAASRVQEEFIASVRAGMPLQVALDDFERGLPPGSTDGRGRYVGLPPGRTDGRGRIVSPEEASEEGTSSRAPTGEGTLRIALLGHGYNIHDPYLNMDMGRRLEALGCEVVPVEAVPVELCERALEKFNGYVYWLFARRVLGPVIHFMENGGVDGLVYVVSFGCGPDALLKALIDLWAKRRPGLPYMAIVLDEHSGEAGLRTRIEAFVDMTRRMRARERQAAKEPRREREDLFVRHVRGPEARRGLVSFPHAGIVSIPLRATMEELGLNVLVPPETTRRTLDIGATHSPELACLPFKLMLGNYVEALERGATHLLGISSRFGATCRLYFFPPVHEAILRDMGHDFELIALDSGRRDSVNEIAKVLRERKGTSLWRFTKLFFATFWRKLRACERVELLAAEARPAEVTRGQATRLMRRALKAIDAAEPYRLRRLLKSVEEEFRSIERKQAFRPLRIGLVGELFVLLDSFSNRNIEERLGNLGVHVKRNFWLSKKIRRAVWPRLDPEYFRAMRAASAYLGVNIGAECNVTIGDTVEYRREGFDGLVHLMPFTCMPEIVAESILPRAKADSGMPVITFALDEQTSEAGMQTRLEAFVDLLSRQRDRPGGSRAPGTRAH